MHLNENLGRKPAGQTLKVRVVIPREERGIEEFHDEEFLARKSSEENKRGKRGIDRPKKRAF